MIRANHAEGRITITYPTKERDWQSGEEYTCERAAIITTSDAEYLVRTLPALIDMANGHVALARKKRRDELLRELELLVAEDTA